MKKLKSCLTILSLVVVLFHASTCFSASTLVNYQGRVLGENGLPVSDRAMDVTFRIYAVEVDGAAVWEEARQVKVENGSYNVLLGSVHPLDESVLESAPCWIEAAIEGEKAAPRQKIVPASYAANTASPDSTNAARDHSADPDRDTRCYSRQEVDATIASIQSILLAQQAHIGNLQDLTLTQQGQIATLLKLAESQQVQITAQAGEITGLYGLAAGLQDQESPRHFQSTPSGPRLVFHRPR